ncbi:MAG: PH domain-containing protein [bacterium]
MNEIYTSGVKEAKKSIEKIRDLIEKRGSESLFTAFATFPKTICFGQQEEGEEVVLFLRQHFVINLPWMILVLLALVVQAFFPLFPPFANLPGNYQLVITLMWYLLVFGFALGKLMGWFFNIFILTDERVIDVDFINLFMRKISITKIDDIQDVSSTVSGAAGTMFGYGSIVIQTAGEMPEFEMNNVPHPEEVVKIVNQLVDEEEQEKVEGRTK